MSATIIPELAGDSVARREVSARLAALQALLETELHKAFDSARWFRKNHQPKRLRQSDLNSIASESGRQTFSTRAPNYITSCLTVRSHRAAPLLRKTSLLRNMVVNRRNGTTRHQRFPGGRGACLRRSSKRPGSMLVMASAGCSLHQPKAENDPCRLAPWFGGRRSTT